MNNEVLNIIQSMRPISLDEMKDVRLMNRVDTKYLVTSRQLQTIFENIHHNYFIQEIEGKRVATYNTVYYDTEDLQMYTIHHDRHLVRDKVRVRTYIDSDLTFCEVKHKNNKGRTSKKRIQVTYQPVITDDAQAREFLSEHQPYPVSQLHPQLVTLFDRITLVNYEMTERLTIDCNLRFNNLTSKQDASFGSLVVMELKQDGRAHSLLKDVLFEMRIRPFKISKYCIGTCLTRSDIRQNRFKKKLRKIAKLKDH